MMKNLVQDVQRPPSAKEDEDDNIKNMLKIQKIALTLHFVQDMHIVQELDKMG